MLNRDIENMQNKDPKMKIRLYFDDLLSLGFPPVNAAVFSDLTSGDLSDIVSPLLYN